MEIMIFGSANFEDVLYYFKNFIDGYIDELKTQFSKMIKLTN